MGMAKAQAMAQGGHNMSLRNKEAWNRIESELGSLNPEAPEATRNSLRNIRQYYSYLMGRESPNAPAPLYPGDYRNSAGTVIHQRGNAMTWEQAQQQGWK
jgi:hypothetical protein